MRNDELLHPILQRAAKDEWFQKCWKFTADEESRFGVVRDALTAEQQESLDKYLAAREELALSMVYAAYALGQELK